MKIILWLSSLFCVSNINAQNTDKRFIGLDTAFTRTLKELNAVGFSVAVVEKNKILYAKGFGYADLKIKKAATENTVYAIGSCTKAFTSSLLGILQKEDKLNYDDKLTKHLPNLCFFNNEMNSNITLRDAMCHRTGLPRHDLSWYLFVSNNRDSLLQRIKYQEPSYTVKEKWQYNNFMFLAQGVVAEKITGKTWEENLISKIALPLGIKNMSYSVSDLAKNINASKGYTYQKKKGIEETPYYNLDAMGPAGSINASVLDMAAWLQCWINGGKLNGKEVLPAAYIKEATSSQMVMAGGLPSADVPDVHFNNYGFGWMLASYKGHYRVEHGGNINGFTASTCFFPSDSIGIVVLCNQGGSRVNAVVRNLITDRLLKLKYKDWTTSTKINIDSTEKTAEKAKLAATSNKKINTKTSHTLTDYDGLYSNAAYGSMSVMLQNDSLFASLPNDKWWLRHYHYDVFEPFDVTPNKPIDTSDAGELKIQFTMSEAGEIDGLKMNIEPSIGKPIEFVKTSRPKKVSSADLKQYEGSYLISGMTIIVAVVGEKLKMTVPDQPEYELVPIDTDKFSLKDLKGFSAKFNKNEKGEVTELVLMQPNGNFAAKKK
jgi:CubicO group peptidase (beta-lactamase class C family)